ncbi:MAG: hypothetical protein JST91_03260 [Actinobacteria bacterium]|nr:hypothetical protein [Actinomycetota bacterium]
MLTTIHSGKELVHLALKEPAEDLAQFAGRLVDYITDQAMLEAVMSSTPSDPVVGVGPVFTRTFDAMFRAVLGYLDRVNPDGADLLRAGISDLAEAAVSASLD